MATRYFDLSEDVYLPGRWTPGHPTDASGRPLDDPWQFRVGAPAKLKTGIRIPIDRPGKPLDFSHAAFSIPIIHARVASIFTTLAPNDVELIPVEIDLQPAQHFILNAVHALKCIDDTASEDVQYWTEEDGLPEKVGTYFSVAGMRIAPAKVGNAHLFRPWGWTVALIVSEHIKQALEDADVTGTKFKEV
ncbi:imm11 family protein [Pyxidicoccus sp. 3LG]